MKCEGMEIGAERLEMVDRHFVPVDRADALEMVDRRGAPGDGGPATPVRPLRC